MKNHQCIYFQVSWLTGVVTVSYLYRFLFICIQALGFKFLCIVICKRLVIIDDIFFAMFLNLANILMATLIGVMSFYTQQMCNIETHYIGLPIELASQTPLAFE